MAKEIDKLDPIDRGIILRAPAVVALLAAVSDDGIVSEDEKAMLSDAFNIKSNSRLGCQIELTPDLNEKCFEIAPE